MESLPVNRPGECWLLGGRLARFGHGRRSRPAGRPTWAAERDAARVDLESIPGRGDSPVGPRAVQTLQSGSRRVRAHSAAQADSQPVRRQGRGCSGYRRRKEGL